MTKQADLISYVFEGQPHLLSDTIMSWMESSSRFTSFIETYRDKVRKKIRVTREPERILDLRSELEVAYCLLNDRRLEVAYEPYASAKRRGPDFAVTYRTNLVFNIEVSRLRTQGVRAGSAAIGSDVDRSTIKIPPDEERILRILLEKLGQMQPGMANLLVIHSPDELARSIDLGRLMQGIKTRVEGKDPSFYTGSRYASPSAFYRDFLRLSGILLWVSQAQSWVNKQARPGLEGKVLRLVASLPSDAVQAPT